MSGKLVIYLNIFESMVDLVDRLRMTMMKKRLAMR